MRLCLALGKTLNELRQSMGSTELTLWYAYECLYGLPVGRLEAAIAISGSAVCGAMGCKVEPQKLIPKFKEPPKDNRPFLAAMKAMAHEMNQRYSTK